MDGMTLPPSPMQALQAEHERLLGRLDDAGGAPCVGPTPPSIDKLSFETQALIHEARSYIERSKAESEWISDARDRSQLRANLRFWASFLLNCTGSYPDTTLRPARPFQPGDTGPPRPGGGSGAIEPTDWMAENTGAAAYTDQGVLEQEKDEEEQEVLDEAREMLPEKPTWFSRLSRFIGLLAILIVGIIPLAAVCLALSLFYNLDNTSPWVFPGNAATQTATAASLLPSVTPEPPKTNKPSPTPELLITTPRGQLPLLTAQVTVGEPSPQGSNCTPVLVLSLEAPEQVNGTPNPAGSVVVYLAGTDEAVARGTLEPGAEPLTIRLEEPSQGQMNFDWLVQVDHPWLGVEAVILSGAVFENCAQNQVSIVYQTESGAEAWQQALEAFSSGGISLSWKLLTWGPDALVSQDWVAAVKLQAAGGNENYVYFARGDLAVPSTASPINGMLPGDQVVLGQERCVSIVSQIGVTSAGQSLSRALAVQLVLPECR